MRKILLFLIIFLFIYPIFPKFLPIPLDRVLQVCGAAVFVLFPQDLRKILNTKIIYRFYGITSILLILAFIAQLQVSKGMDLYFFKEVLDAYFYVFSAYLICWMMRRTYGYVSVGLLLYYLSLAAVAQTLISFVFFFNPSVFDSYISLLKEETNQGLFERTSLIGRRFIGFGSQFFSGVIKYGFSFFAIMVLPFVHSNRLTRNKSLYWMSVVLIAVGGLLTGRTFFIAIGLGIAMVVLLRSKSVMSFFLNNVKALIGVFLALIFLLVLANLFMDAERFENVYNFVFELFINFFESDSLETKSTNRMQEMYFFPDNLNTWLFGDGKMISDTGGYYMRTDIGFIRLLFYFGLPSTLFFIFVLYKYYKILRNETQQRSLRYLFFFMTVWMLFLNLKGLAYEPQYFVVFIILFLFENREKNIKNVS